MNQSQSFAAFFKYAQTYLQENKKKLQLVNARNINSPDGKCSGWCDGKTLAVATKNPIATEVFVHEFSHMNQAIEASSLWKNNYKFWSHLKRKTLALSNWDYVMEVIELERDCEMRALKHSKKWSLFDNQLYAQRANVYLLFYHYVFIKQKWSTSTVIYNPILVDAMPNKILPLDYFYKIDMNIMKLFDSCLLRGGSHYNKQPLQSALINAL